MAKTAATKKEESPEAIRKKLVLTGADIVAIGEEAELLVGGKNYNTALISQIEGIQAPYFRAISSLAFHRVLDETKVTGRIVRAVVDHEYGRIDWNDPEINQDPDFLQKFVRQLGKQIHDAAAAEGDQSHTKLRTFINTIVEGFATSPEGIDQLRKRIHDMETLDPSLAEKPARRSNTMDDIEKGLSDFGNSMESLFNSGMKKMGLE